MKTVANCDIASIVKDKAIDVNGYGNMCSRTKDTSGYWTGGRTWLPHPIQAIYQARRDSIAQVIYSYNTPIAWLDAGLWVMPDVRYSPTTGKHQSHLYPLKAELIPGDCSLDEYMRVLNAQMRFVRDGRNLKTVPATR